MKIVDKIALNRAIKILTDFILKLIKLFNSPQKPIEEPKPKPKRPLDRVLPWRNHDK